MRSQRRLAWTGVAILLVAALVALLGKWLQGRPNPECSGFSLAGECAPRLGGFLIEIAALPIAVWGAIMIGIVIGRRLGREEEAANVEAPPSPRARDERHPP